MGDYEKGGNDYFSGQKQGARLGGDDDVECCLFMRPNNTFFMKVRVRSHIKQNIWTEYEIDMDRYSSEHEFLQAVGVAAAAACEHQAKTYGDTHSENEVMKMAVEAAVEMLHEVNKPKH